MLQIDNDSYIWSDIHQSHWKICEYCDRKFESIDQMNNTLMESLKTLPRGSTLFDLGDISFGNYETASTNYRKYFSTLLDLGVHRLYITLGNHDKHLVNYLGSLEGKPFRDFVRVDNYFEVQYKKHYKFVMMHYPLMSWNGIFKGWYHLHGHQHKDEHLNSCENIYHVGVDTIGYVPLKLEEVVDRINRRTDRNAASN